MALNSLSVEKRDPTTHAITAVKKLTLQEIAVTKLLEAKETRAKAKAKASSRMEAVAKEEVFSRRTRDSGWACIQDPPKDNGLFGNRSPLAKGMARSTNVIRVASIKGHYFHS